MGHHAPGGEVARLHRHSPRLRVPIVGDDREGGEVGRSSSTHVRHPVAAALYVREAGVSTARGASAPRLFFCNCARNCARAGSELGRAASKGWHWEMIVVALEDCATASVSRV